MGRWVGRRPQRREVSLMPSMDFAEVRARVPMVRVLELLRFEPVRRSGAELRGPCPIHGSRSPRSRSFAANLAKHVFRCLQCGAAGNVLDLYAAVHQVDVYRAAIELCKRLGIALPEKAPCLLNRKPPQASARRSDEM